MTLNFNCSVLVFFRNIIWFYFLIIDIILDSTRKSKGPAQLWTVNVSWSWPPPWVMVTLNERAAPQQLALIFTGIRFSLSILHSLCFVKMVLQALGFSPNLFLGTDRSPVDLGNCKKVKGLSYPSGKREGCQSLDSWKSPLVINFEAGGLIINHPWYLSEKWSASISMWKIRIPWRPSEKLK